MSPECMRTLRRAWLSQGAANNHSSTGRPRRGAEIGWSPEDDPQRAAFIAAKLAEWNRPKVAR